MLMKSTKEFTQKLDQSLQSLFIWQLGSLWANRKGQILATEAYTHLKKMFTFLTIKTRPQ